MGARWQRTKAILFLIRLCHPLISLATIPLRRHAPLSRRTPCRRGVCDIMSGGGGAPAEEKEPAGRTVAEPRTETRPERKRPRCHSPVRQDTLPDLESVPSEGLFHRLMGALDCCSCRILDAVLGPADAQSGKEAGRLHERVGHEEIVYTYDDCADQEEIDAQLEGAIGLEPVQPQNITLYGERAKVTGDIFLFMYRPLLTLV